MSIELRDAMRIEGLRKENARLRKSLQSIADASIPSQPAAYNNDEAWASRHVSTMRQMAREALSE